MPQRTRPARCDCRYSGRNSLANSFWPSPQRHAAARSTQHLVAGQWAVQEFRGGCTYLCGRGCRNCHSRSHANIDLYTNTLCNAYPAATGITIGYTAEFPAAVANGHAGARRNANIGVALIPTSPARRRR